MDRQVKLVQGQLQSFSGQSDAELIDNQATSESSLGTKDMAKADSGVSERHV